MEDICLPTPLWTAWGSSPMRWNTSFTGYLKHFCWRCPFLSHEGWGFETLYECEIHNPGAGCPPSTISIQLLRLYQWPTDRSGVLPRWTSWEDLTVLLKHRNASRFLKGKFLVLWALRLQRTIKWNIGNCPVQISRAESFGRKGGSNSQELLIVDLRIMIQTWWTLMNIGSRKNSLIV